ncbi:MAG TPA: Cys-tRNA(Pro) deacylase [Acidimicrobiia bacterium]|jgi:Cys-tRNA(Pro)/Cys-tRNA(Cys) deacylase|nr:Cys-tRNA(Pro) deacylase [Acidimicrobiia bacterium]
MSTPAVRALEKAGVSFELHTYEVDEPVGAGYGEAVAAAIGAEAGRVFKTLMAVVDGDHVAAIVPVDSRLSLKALAGAAGGKKAAMADPADAERLTGYVTGGISPLGQRRRVRMFLDEAAAVHPTIYVSAGKRGLQVELSPDDLVGLTAASLAPLT